MTKAEKVLAFYKSLLATLDIADTGDNDDGLLSHVGSGEPIMVDGKRLALPTKDNIRLAGKDEVVVFHPLSENVFEGMSEVFIEFRHIVTAKIHKIIAYTAHTLIKLVLNKATHEGLTNAQMGAISKLDGVDEKFLESFKKMMNKLEVNGQHQLVNIFMKYGGTLNDAKYMRIAFVSFPLLELIEANEDGVILDVKFRKKDIALLKAVFELVIPKAFDKNVYSAGSNSSIAPYFCALLLAMCHILEDTAGITWRFRSYIEEEVGESQHITAKDILDKLAGDDSVLGFVNAIPPMPYNTGDNVTGNIKDDSSEVKASTRPGRAGSNRAASRDEDDDDNTEDLRSVAESVMGISRRDTRGGLRGRDDDDYRHPRRNTSNDSRRSGGLRDDPDIRGRGHSRRIDPTRGGLRDQPTNYRITGREDMEDLRRGRRGESTNPLMTLKRIKA